MKIFLLSAGKDSLDDGVFPDADNAHTVQGPDGIRDLKPEMFDRIWSWTEAGAEDRSPLP